LTIALRPPGMPPPIVNEKIVNRQFWVGPLRPNTSLGLWRERQGG
jgi:hypothetical protein